MTTGLARYRIDDFADAVSCGNPAAVVPLDRWLTDQVMQKIAAEIAAIAPDFAALERLRRGIAVTAPGEDCDCVSRYFAPHLGIPEDPVTGAAHCTLIPYWAGRLGKARIHARQLSARGGDLICELAGERVRIGGRAVMYLEGWITV